MPGRRWRHQPAPNTCKKHQGFAFNPEIWGFLGALDEEHWRVYAAIIRSISSVSRRHQNKCRKDNILGLLHAGLGSGENAKWIIVIGAKSFNANSRQSKVLEHCGQSFANGDPRLMSPPR